MLRALRAPKELNKMKHSQLLKTSLIALTLISVTADTLLLPFYPKFFLDSFGIDDANHVGWYIAACCISVMLALPLWAKIAKHIHELHLWVITQVIASLLGIFCAQTQSLIAFWIASQVMLVFKASYLLIYPFVLRLEDKDKHLGVASLFSVLMHFGAIGGAFLGGLTLDYFPAQHVYYIMAASDILQVMICVVLIYSLNIAFKPVDDQVLESYQTSSKNGSKVLEAKILQ